MKNLAGVDTPICDSLIRIELAKAGIVAYRGKIEQRREVPASLVGIICYAGVTATFWRAWTYWSVSVTQPVPYAIAKKLNDKYGSTVRVEGYAGGKTPADYGVSHYNVDTQDGLNALVKTFGEAFGATQEAHPERIVLPDWMYPCSAEIVSAPESGAELQRAEIAALNGLGGYYQRYEAREAMCEEALKLAESSFGAGDRDTRAMRVVVNNLYRDQSRRLKMLLAGKLDDSSRYVFTAELEEILNKRIDLLKVMGRFKEARSVTTECASVRNTLAEIFRERRAEDQSDLEKSIAGEPTRVESRRFELAFTTMRMIQLYRRMGKTDGLHQLEAEMSNLRSALDEGRLQELARLEAKQ